MPLVTIRGPMLLGMALVGLALVGSVWFLSLRARPQPATPSPPSSETVSARLPSGQVAMVLRPNLAAAAAGAVRAGDHVHVYAFLPAQPGAQPVTRLLLRDTLVYTATREADAQTLTLGMQPEQALLMQHTTQLGGKPFVVLHPSQAKGGGSVPEQFTEADLLAWLGRRDAGSTQPSSPVPPSERSDGPR